MFLFSNQSRESTMEEPHSHIIMPALFCKVLSNYVENVATGQKKYKPISIGVKIAQLQIAYT